MLPTDISTYTNALLNAIPIGLMVCAPDGRVLFLNLKARQQAQILTDDPLQPSRYLHEYISQWLPYAETYLQHFNTAVAGQSGLVTCVVEPTPTPTFTPSPTPSATPSPTPSATPPPTSTATPTGTPPPPVVYRVLLPAVVR